MKRLVLLGEGHGEVSALPILVRRLLQEKDEQRLLRVDQEVIRTKPLRLVKWDKQEKQPNFSEWERIPSVAARKPDLGGILAVYDGDAAEFPAGSARAFCASAAAKAMAASAAQAGAGKLFSLAVVFACTEFETWLVAGAESLAGKRLEDGRPALPSEVSFPSGNAESHGKRWLETHFPNYRPTRDQAPLTRMVNLQCIRNKQLRSFQRLEHALAQLLEAVASGRPVFTPV